MTKLLKLLVIMVFMGSANLLAEPKKTDQASKGRIDNTVLLSKIKKHFPGVKHLKINSTPLKSIYEVVVGTKIYYVSADGTYLIAGQMWNLKTKTNITAQSLKKMRKSFRSVYKGILDGMKESNMIIFSPPAGKVKYTITVFTDLDCHYCRIMHKQIKGYMQLGIRVRYVLYPRAAKSTPSYAKAISVWCSKDRHATFTYAKTGQAVAAKTCTNPIDANVAIGASLGIRGTPAIFFSSGQSVPGYVDPARLLAMLKADK